MRAWLRSLFFKVSRGTHSDAFKLGQQAASAITKDALKTIDDLLKDRRLNFLAVLDGRLSAISDVQDVSYRQQAEIEFKVMLENWSERMPEQKSEIWNALARRWSPDLILSAPDELQEIISSRVEWHYSQLFSEGLEHAANAVGIDDRGTASGNI